MRRISLVVVVLIAFAFIGCSDTELSSVSSSTEGVTTEYNVDVETDTSIEADETLEESDLYSYDIDLSVMSSTIAYSAAYDIFYTADEHLGDRIKVTGICYSGYDEPTDENYYAVVITDALACCSMGFEFVLDGDVLEEDYPADGEEITIIGEFELYESGGYTFCRLGSSVIL